MVTFGNRLINGPNKLKPILRKTGLLQFRLDLRKHIKLGTGEDRVRIPERVVGIN